MIDRKHRAAWMYHVEKKTLAEIGEHFGVTRECIRLWLKEIGQPSSRAAYSARSQTAARRRFERLAWEVSQLEGERLTAARIADELDCPIEVAGKVLRATHGGQRDSKRRIARFTNFSPGTRVSDEELIARLREAADVLPSPLASVAFSDWARPRGYRGHQTYLIRFGTWRQALAAAGLPANTTGGRRPQITYERCFDAVLRVGRRLGSAPTIAEYMRLSRDEDPSAATVRRFAGWIDYVRDVQAQLDEEARA